MLTDSSHSEPWNQYMGEGNFWMPWRPRVEVLAPLKSVMEHSIDVTVARILLSKQRNAPIIFIKIKVLKGNIVFHWHKKLLAWMPLAYMSKEKQEPSYQFLSEFVMYIFSHKLCFHLYLPFLKKSFILCSENGPDWKAWKLKSSIYPQTSYSIGSSSTTSFSRLPH